MKKLALTLLCSLLALRLAPAAPAPTTSEKVYTCRFEEGVPYGVSAWHQAVANRKDKETRFELYSKKSAKDLSNDALVDRGGEGAGEVDPRETAFYQAYDEKGWYIYIEAKEPEVKNLLDNLIDPRSGGHKESYELFFTPGLERVPYYQIFIHPYRNKVSFYDWAMANRDYRSLKEETHVESLPLKDGVGTFVFIPWHLIYERVPLEGGTYRFTLIRWMPFSKAPGMTWGGRVHETGRFGNVVFAPPTPAQREAISLRLLRYAWFKFQTRSAALAEFWEDQYIGDPAFYEAAVKPEVERLNAVAASWGEPDTWGAAQIKEGSAVLKDWMEFDYLISQRRTEYLRDQRFAKK